MLCSKQTLACIDLSKQKYRDETFRCLALQKKKNHATPNEASWVPATGHGNFESRAFSFWAEQTEAQLR